MSDGRPVWRLARERYADQNERDFAAFTDAIASGRLEATRGV